MRLSTSLKRNIIKTVVGGVTNISQGIYRRYTLFFEDILALYVKECENAGYDMYNIDKKWMNLVMSKHFRGIITKLPIRVFLNVFMKNIWIGLGLMDDFRFTKKDNIVTIETKNEGVTRIIGKNTGMVGFYAGILNVLFRSEAHSIDIYQSKKSCRYVYELDGICTAIKSKSKGQYNKLNYIEEDIRGVDLKNALEKNILHLSKGNKLYFRGKFLCPIENTIFHLIGNKGIMLNKISEISYDYFSILIDDESNIERKLILLKTLLQVMGWGVVKIVIKSDTKISVDIKNPPYGLQLEKDNWDFLLRTIQGFLWLINTNFKIEKINEGYKRITVDYITDGSVL